MSLKPREKWLLGLLVVAVLGAGVRAVTERWKNVDGGERPASLALANSGTSTDRSGGLATEVVELRLSELELEPGEYHPGRDPFRFGADPKPVPPPRQAPPKPPPKPPQPEATRPAGPKLPEIDFVYLGSFGPSQRRIAVFSDGEGIYNAMAGDILDGKFVVDRIGYETVELKFVDFPAAPAEQLQIGG